jgi:hypothetical protein
MVEISVKMGLYLLMPCENRDFLVLTSHRETSLSKEAVIYVQILMSHNVDLHLPFGGCASRPVQTFGMLQSHTRGSRRESNILITTEVACTWVQYRVLCTWAPTLTCDYPAPPKNPKFQPVACS